LLEPGLVWTSHWRPEDEAIVDMSPAQSAIYAGVGRLPG
jgi:hypothetical protein